MFLSFFSHMIDSRGKPGHLLYPAGREERNVAWFVLTEMAVRMPCGLGVE